MDIIIKIKKELKKIKLLLVIKKYFDKIPFALRIYNFLLITIENLIQLFSGKERILTKGSSTFFGDLMATKHHVGFLNERKFQEAYEEAFSNVQAFLKYIAKDHIMWRAHICTWAAQQGIRLGGDFIECGVWYGLLSKTICEYVDFEKYSGKFYLVDSWGYFKGVETKEIYHEDIFDIVNERFKKYDNVKLIKGVIPEVLSKVETKNISYLSIDMNGAIAERKALEYFYNKIIPGGIIYFDDYGWDYPELRKTVDEFFEDKPENILHFPTGNSIVVKL